MLSVQYKFTFTFLWIQMFVQTLYLFSLTLYCFVWILFPFTVRRHHVIRPEFMLHVNQHSLNEQRCD